MPQCAGLRTSPGDRPVTGVGLVIETPPGYSAERDWIADVIVGEFLGLAYRRVVADRRDVRIVSDDGQPGELRLPDILFNVPDAERLTHAALPRDPRARMEVHGVPEAGVDDIVPLYAESAGVACVTHEGDRIRLAVDLFGAAFTMLSRLEECVDGPRDLHGRLPSAASLAGRGGFLERPVVNEYSEVLYALLRRLWPELRRPSRRYTLRPTHDVDFPLVVAGRGAAGIARRALGDIVLRRSLRLAAGSIRGALSSDPRRDPAHTFDFLMDVSEAHGQTSEFNFLCGRGASEFDGDYELDERHVVELMRDIHRRGHRIGLHPGYLTRDDPAEIARQFEMLRAAADQIGIEQEEWGGRQHFLRWRNPHTWRGWDRAGLDYDSTLGFADHVGFRCGVCYPFRTFDVVARRPLRLLERPLQVMDVTLTDYMGLSPDEGIARADSLARTIRRYGGEMQVLWHNTHLLTRGARDHYQRLIEAIRP